MEGMQSKQWETILIFIIPIITMVIVNPVMAVLAIASMIIMIVNSFLVSSAIGWVKEEVNAAHPRVIPAAPPNEYLCPITMAIMKDPVLCADGHSYERADIQRWLNRSQSSPKTNAPLSSKSLTPNHALRGLTMEWDEKMALNELNGEWKERHRPWWRTLPVLGGEGVLLLVAAVGWVVVCFQLSRLTAWTMTPLPPPPPSCFSLQAWVDTTHVETSQSLW
eukprot:CAMPEP_0180135118 /NCGR_PEP_ID=MMETSP0986-20121125/10626_1 /TAXON_ID=697907 /ORGANISM="non described non described, Strain CCMP2293" /LENGTH=220 /DNA_ID=CAMNT_0022075727 /DNA_START=19 /DNA_END=678 /DNA_ORIENTATION=+